MQGRKGRTGFNGGWRAIDMHASYSKVAPLTVHFNGRLRMWCVWYTSPYAAWNGSADEDMNPGFARRVFRVTLELSEVGLCPGINVAMRIDAVIQVHPGIVSMEHISNAIIVTGVLRLDCLDIRGPGLGGIGFGVFACCCTVGDFGELALALFFAPAHPLWPRLQFFQGG